MKHLRNLVLLSLTLGLPNVYASTPVVKKVEAQHVYTPKGFDTNDNSEVVIAGMLPNLCHKSPSTKVTRDGNKINIELTTLYYHESNPFCPEMQVPFLESVYLGILDKGLYEITINGESTSQKTNFIEI